MELRVALEGPGTWELHDLRARLDEALPGTSIVNAPDALFVHASRTGIADLVNALAQFVRDANDETAVTVDADTGARVRLDIAVAANAFEMLMLVNTLNPPVGLG